MIEAQIAEILVYSKKNGTSSNYSSITIIVMMYTYNSNIYIGKYIDC